MTTITDQIRLGDYVTDSYGHAGRVYQLHDACPESDAWCEAQDQPITADERAGRWASVLVDEGGAVVAPISRLTQVAPFNFKHRDAHLYFHDDGVPTHYPDELVLDFRARMTQLFGAMPYGGCVTLRHAGRHATSRGYEPMTLGEIADNMSALRDEIARVASEHLDVRDELDQFKRDLAAVARLLAFAQQEVAR